MHIFKSTTVLLALTLAVVAGCQSPFANDEEVPEHARVLIDGEAGSSLRLVTSNSFEQNQDPETGAMQIRLFEADTATVTVPFDQKFPLGPLARILVRLSNPDTVPVEVRMQVILGTDKKFDQTVDLDEQTLQFGWAYF